MVGTARPRETRWYEARIARNRDTGDGLLGPRRLARSRTRAHAGSHRATAGRTGIRAADFAQFGERTHHPAQGNDGAPSALARGTVARSRCRPRNAARSRTRREIRPGRRAPALLENRSRRNAVAK